MKTHNGNQPSPPHLSSRETEILTFSALGKTRREISEILSISEETVKVYIERVCQKLGANNKTHAVTIAIISGMIDLSGYKI